MPLMRTTLRSCKGIRFCVQLLVHTSWLEKDETGLGVNKGIVRWLCRSTAYCLGLSPNIAERALQPISSLKNSGEFLRRADMHVMSAEFIGRWRDKRV